MTRGAPWLAAALLGACGARSELLDRPSGGAGLDASAGDARPAGELPAADRALVRPDVVLRRCDGGALPRAGAASRVTVPSRVGAAVVLDPVRRELLVIGGLEESGRWAREALRVGLDDRSVTPLTMQGDAVLSPLGALALWDAENARAVLIGGGVQRASNDRAAQVFSAQRDGGVLRVRRLPEHPAGPIIGVAGAYDAAGRRAIVTGGESMDPRARATFALSLEPGRERWQELAAPEQSPPRRFSAVMAYDPARDRFVLAGGYTAAGSDRTVWVLGRTARWAQVPGALDAVPTANALLWDPSACGFWVPASRCTRELWFLRVEGEVYMQPAGQLVFPSPTPSFPEGVFDPVRREVLLYGGDSCSTSGFFRDALDVVALSD